MVAAIYEAALVSTTVGVSIDAATLAGSVVPSAIIIAAIGIRLPAQTMHATCKEVALVNRAVRKCVFAYPVPSVLLPFAGID